MIVLQNAILKTTVNPKGAELNSLIDKRTAIEHIWQADSSVWGRHAPVLFPIVGKLKDDTTIIDGQSYNMTQHGFARDQVFEVVNQSMQEVSLSLKSNDVTLALYPYEFELIITYRLVDATLETHYSVRNTSEDELWFSIGAHPGFTCPFDSGESFDDYYIEFEKAESAERLLFADGLLTGKSTPFLDNQKILPINHELFSKDAVIFKGLASTYCLLKSKKHDTTLRFDFKGFEYLAFWTKPGTNAPYICIEPWFGVADSVNSDGIYHHKEGIQLLKANKTFDSVYSVGIE